MIIKQQPALIKTSAGPIDIIQEFAPDVIPALIGGGIAAAKGGAIGAGILAGLGVSGSVAFWPITATILTAGGIAYSVYSLTKLTDKNLYSVIERLNALDPNKQAEPLVSSFINELTEIDQSGALKEMQYSQDPVQKLSQMSKQLDGLKKFFNVISRLYNAWPQIRPNLIDWGFDAKEAENAIFKTYEKTNQDLNKLKEQIKEQSAKNIDSLEKKMDSNTIKNTGAFTIGDGKIVMAKLWGLINDDDNIKDLIDRLEDLDVINMPTSSAGATIKNWISTLLRLDQELIAATQSTIGSTDLIENLKEQNRLLSAGLEVTIKIRDMLQVIKSLWDSSIKAEVEKHEGGYDDDQADSAINKTLAAYENSVQRIRDSIAKFFQNPNVVSKINELAIPVAQSIVNNMKKLTESGKKIELTDAESKYISFANSIISGNVDYSVVLANIDNIKQFSANLQGATDTVFKAKNVANTKSHMISKRALKVGDQIFDLTGQGTTVSTSPAKKDTAQSQTATKQKIVRSENIITMQKLINIINSKLSLGIGHCYPDGFYGKQTRGCITDILEKTTISIGGSAIKSTDVFNKYGHSIDDLDINHSELLQNNKLFTDILHVLVDVYKLGSAAGSTMPESVTSKGPPKDTVESTQSAGNLDIKAIRVLAIAQIEAFIHNNYFRHVSRSTEFNSFINKIAQYFVDNAIEQIKESDSSTTDTIFRNHESLIISIKNLAKGMANRHFTDQEINKLKDEYNIK